MGWPVTENEVEGGYLYTQNALVSKDYSGNANNFIFLSSGGDVQNALSNNNNTEIYGQYTIGISTGPGMGTSKNGITIFNPLQAW